VHDLEAVAVRKLGRRMLGARHDFTISFDGDRPFGETETIQETADGQAGVHDAGLSVDDELHVPKVPSWRREGVPSRTSSNHREKLRNREQGTREVEGALAGAARGLLSFEARMTAQTDPVSTGDLIGGKYRVERVLGRGGMGVVVAATHAHLGQRVAIKFLLKEAMESEGVAARFLREGRTMVQLTSEHVARVTDVGTHENGAPYLVMEYLEGRDLGEVVQAKGPLSAPEVVDYLLQACEAVAEAHALKVVHRDLKPGNLFLTRRPDGSPLVKVLDFGISKAHEPAGNKLTQTAAVMGSPAYMSPEQVRSTTNVDQRTDVWSLGVIAYELLTNKLPFEAPTMSGMFAAIVASPMVPIAQRRPDLHPDLARAVEKALVKEVDGRFQSVAELANALAPFGTDSARISAQRVQRQLHGSSGWEHAGAPAVTAGRLGTSPNAATSTTGPHVGTSTPASRGLALFLGGLVLVLAGAAGGVFMLQRRTPAPEATLEPTAAVVTATAAPAASPAAPPEAATPEPSASPSGLAIAPSASAAPVPAPAVAKSAQVARTPRPARAPTPTPPKPAKFDPLGGR
jgi:serine/threonine protein kinase